MISRISSIISSHATAIPSDEGRVYSLYRKVALPIRPVIIHKDTYSDFTSDRFPKLAEAARSQKKQDLAANSSIYGYGMALYSSQRQKPVQDRNLYRMIIRA
jgi:hypothetical protein